MILKIVAILGAGILAALGMIYAPTLMVVISYAVLLVMCVRLWSIIAWGKCAWLVRTWAKCTGLIPVRVMTCSHEVCHTVVKLQPDGTYTGYFNHMLKLSDIRLMPTGHVDPHCDALWCYIWEPLNKELKTQLQLSYSEQWPDWHAWMEMNHTQMIEHRAKVFIGS